MRFEIPVYVEAEADNLHYRARPLFLSEPVERARHLSRVLARLSNSLRRVINQEKQLPRQDGLTRFLFNPAARDRVLDLSFPFQKRTGRCRLLFVTFRALGRVLAFSPSLPDLWLELETPRELKARAADAVAGYLREHSYLVPEEVGPTGKAWVTRLELDVDLPATFKQREDDGLAAILGGQRVSSGSEELELVGRCLDDLWPEGLPRSLFRDAAVERLDWLVRADGKPPALVVGDPGVGKSALIASVVRLHRERKESRGRRFWLLSGQRLISGMSFLGQWQSRLLAILDEAERHDLVLCFEDFLALYTAGRSRNSDLCVAQVLKPFVERRQVRLLSEMTPEALALFQEKDRGLADQFQLVRLDETPRLETLRILLAAQRALEMELECVIEPEAVEATLELTRRYSRTARFPGKAVTFLRQTAVRHRRGRVTREGVLEQFQARSGLRLEMLDDRVRLDPDDLHERLARSVVGQEEAVQAVAEAVVVAKARLNDPDRPLASFLFLGPTGVGKTHCARALARLMFGDESRLLRFDMNEVLTPGAVARLIGDPEVPEGLLTGAVRRQPHCVLLLDEIEKAHPDAFDLLLQVMGDGRLSDSLGHTVDFTQCFLIMTSNLGADQTNRQLGFRSRDEEHDVTYRRAAEQFFAPEFFNRIDRVIPFSRLPRPSVRRIASALLEELLARDGLVRRQCILDVEEAALDRIVEEGFHPQLGARALRRALEAQVAAPLAARLAAMEPDSPTLLGLHAPLEPGGPVRVSARELAPAPPRDGQVQLVVGLDRSQLLRRLESRLDEVEAQLDRFSPSGTVSSDVLTSVELRYFAARDQLRRVRAALRRRRSGGSRRRRGAPLLLDREGAHRRLLSGGGIRSRLLALEQGLSDHPRESAELDEWAQLVAEASWLENDLRGLEEPGPASLVLEVKSLGPAEHSERLGNLLAGLAEALELEGSFSQGRLRVSGPGSSVLSSEAGCHLFCGRDGALTPVMVQGGDQVVRVYDSELAVDLRTGWVVRGELGAQELRALVLRGLPAPPLREE